MNPNNTIGLLDIDKTLLIDVDILVNGVHKTVQKINQEILDALKKQGITKIYLFSAMDFNRCVYSECSAKLDPQLRKSILTREEIITELKKQGFEFLGVITSADPVYNRGLGAVYNEFFKPAYYQNSKALQNTLENTPSTSLCVLQNCVDSIISGEIPRDASKVFAKKIVITEETPHRMRHNEFTEDLIYCHPEVEENGFINPSFRVPNNLRDLKNGFSQNWPWLAKLPDELNEEQKEFWNKGCMFAYFLHLLPTVYPEIINVVYLDDRIDCLKTTEFLNKHNNNPVNLKTILAEPPLGVEQSISEQIQNHFEKIIISVPAEFLGYATYAPFENEDTIERRMLTHFNDTVAYLRYVEENNKHGLPNDLTEKLSGYLMVLFVNLMSELGFSPDIQNYECELSEEQNKVTFTCYFNGGDIFQVNFEIKTQLHFSMLGCTLVLNPSLIKSEKDRNKFRHALNNTPSFSNDNEIANELGHSRIYVLNHAKCDKVLKEFPNNSISRNKRTTAALATSGVGIIAAAVAGGVALTFITGGAALPFIALGAGAAGGVSLIPGAGALTKKSIANKEKVKKQKSTVANSAVTNARSNQPSNRNFDGLTVDEIETLNDFRTLLLNLNTIKLLELYKTVIDLYPEGYQIGIPPNFLNIITSFLSRLNAVAEVYHRSFNRDIRTLIDTLFSLEEINNMDFNSFASCVSAFNYRLVDESYKSLLMAFQDGLTERRMREFKKRFSRIKNFVQNGGEMVSNEILAEHIQTIADLNERDTNINLADICDVENKEQLNRLQNIVTKMITQINLRVKNTMSDINSPQEKLGRLFKYIADLKQNLSSLAQLPVQPNVQPVAQPNVQPLAQPIAQEPAQAENNPSEEKQNSNLYRQMIEIAEKFGDDQLKLIQETDDRMQKTNLQLQTNAAAYGFTLEDVDGNGNCFFYAIVRQLNRVLDLNLNSYEEGQLSAALRKLACDYIRKNFEKFKEFIKEPQLEEQRQDKEWVEDIVITALCHALNVNLILVRSDESEPTIKRLPNAICDLYLGYQVGLHYQSLTPENDAEQQHASLTAKLEATENSNLAVEPIAKTNEELSVFLTRVVENDNKMVSKIETLKRFLVNNENQSTLNEMLNVPLGKDEEELNTFMKPVLSCYASIRNYALQTNTDITSLAKRLFSENFSEIDISSIDIDVLKLIKQLLEKYSEINPALSHLIAINDAFYEALGGNSLVDENGGVMQGNNRAGFFSRPPSPNNVMEAETPTLASIAFESK